MANRLCFIAICTVMLLGSIFVSFAEDTPARLNYSDIYSQFEYPEAALKNEIDAIAFVEVSIDETGFAYLVNVKQSDYFCYRRPIITAVMDNKHVPAMENGKPVKSKFLDTLYFPFPQDFKTSQGDRRSRYFRLHADDYSLKSDSAGKTAKDSIDVLDSEPEFDFAKLKKSIIYPEALRKLAIEGIVFMRIYIDSNGIVKKSFPFSSPHVGLSLAAEEAILRTEFKPAMYKGKPVGIWFEIPFYFQLK